MVERKRRVQWSRKEWARRVAEWRRSGLPAPEFCRRRGGSAKTLRWWAWRLAATAAEATGLVAVEVERPRNAEAGRGGAFEVQLGNGVVVRVGPSFDELALGRLLDCLVERLRC